MGILLETEGLCKDFKKQRTVKNISLHVRENSVYGLLGPNGAGKSTTLKMITGMLRPSGGKIYFDGHPWSRKDLEHMGALIESPPLYENLSAKENLKVRTKLLDIPERRIEEVLDTVGLQDTGRKRAGQFSMGMKQRLGIAVALLNHPKLLILDEPDTYIDRHFGNRLYGLLDEINRDCAVILVSHDVEVLLQHAKSVAFINGTLRYHEGAGIPRAWLDESPFPCGKP